LFDKSNHLDLRSHDELYRLSLYIPTFDTRAGSRIGPPNAEQIDIISPFRKIYCFQSTQNETYSIPTKE